MLNRFHLLEVSLAAVLAMVGAKMLVGEWVEQWIGHSIDQWVLALVGVILLGGIVASLVVPPPEEDGDD